MKRPNFEDFKNRQMIFFGVKGLLCTTGVQIPTYIFRLLTGYHWGAVVISRKVGVSSREGTSCCVIF
jgi:hypothetical protein